ncbi:unnamed protein product [Adineta ricciae]|uniref:Uncharacterized protein n=1 Tax=Adineta ricciae TaxID=249248 RepID=A0A816D7H7_ADIRI|nr:unnamed protein product [Adineta ricciae]CAF1631059.1 unnamed protein product [Adineta ricciae]
MLCKILIFSLIDLIICKNDWDKMIDRIDFLIKKSYLIIECNSKEIEIIRKVNTFDELSFNFKCQNHKKIFQHEIDQVQIINFEKTSIECEKNGFKMKGHLSREKPSKDKDTNGVEWPFVQTDYGEKKKNDPIKLKFFDKIQEMDLVFNKIHWNNFSNINNSFEFYLKFVNRPMICKFTFHLKSKDFNKNSCQSIQIDDQQINPKCFYEVNSFLSKTKSNLSSLFSKVSATQTPSSQRLDEIIQKMMVHINKTQENYLYLTSISTNTMAITLKNDTNNIDSLKTNKKNTKQSDTKKKKKKLNKKNNSIWTFVGIGTFVLLFITIGIAILCKKTSKSRRMNRTNSNSSY